VHRVAVVGSGPAGIYAAGALAEHGGIAVDVLDQLPAPFGLVRYGVAPDHPKIRSVSRTLGDILQHPAVRFFGNVQVGRHLSVADLQRHYDAVVFAHGAAVDRRLGIAGEDLPGSVSATDFVAWYCGHPDVAPDRFVLDATSVAVIGVGNVAADVTRILARPVTDLHPTEMPAHVLRALETSAVRDVHLIGRRGPLQSKITIRELREIGALDDVDVLLDPRDLELDAATREHLDADPVLRRSWKVLQDWSTRAPTGASRRIHVRFLERPVEIIGEHRVAGLVLERNRPLPDGTVEGTGVMSVVAAQLVLRSIGYRGVPLPGLPFDQRAGVVPHDRGRVLEDGRPLPGQYVTGWIKRGPTGIIGTNKSDAHETVASLLEDLPGLPPAPERDPDAIRDLLAGRGVTVVTWQDWESIERAEIALGQAQGRARATIPHRDDLLRAAAAQHV